MNKKNVPQSSWYCDKIHKKIKCFEEKLNMSCFGKNFQMLELVELSTPWPQCLAQAHFWKLHLLKPVHKFGYFDMFRG